MSLDYGGILRRAWQITWNNKILWLFGILAGLAGGSYGGGNRMPDVNYQFNYQDPDLPPGLRRMLGGDLDQNVVLAIIAGLVCLALVVFLIFVVLSVIGRGGLIGGISLANKQGRVSFGEAWGVGVRKFWVVFAISLVVWIVGLLISGASTLLALTICLAPLACIGFLLVAVLGVWTQLAQIAAVKDNLDIVAALTRAWQVIRDNLANVVVLGLILVVASLVVGFVLAAPAIAIVVPAVMGIIFLSNEAAIAGNVGLIVAGLCLVVYVPIAIIVGGILQTWVTAAWTLGYEQMTGPKPAVVAAAPVIPPAA